MTKKTIAAVGILLLTHTGCGGGSDLSKEEAQKAMLTVTSSMSTGMVEVNAATTESGDGSAVSVNATAPCLSGGNVSTSGSVTADAESFSFELDLTLNACATGNIVADGGMRLAGSLDQAGFDFAMTGAFAFSGEISGTCDIDVSVSADSGDASATAMVGSLCGFDTAELQPSLANGSL